jgi:ABC-2 type transport system ATP-binding protein
MSTLIDLKGINFSYGQINALNNIDLSIGPGIFGLLGPNGAGKTTLMKVLLGFLSPSSGQGSILGFDLKSHKKEIRRRIGYMPENECLLPNVDAVAFTAYLGELSGMPKQEAMKRAHEVLYFVGLEDARYRKIDTYSTGMKQRLKMAQAIVHDPQLLFLDEPTSGMDPKGRMEILEIIRDIGAKKSMNIIFSSHLLADIETTCETVIILNHGRIAATHQVKNTLMENQHLIELRVLGNKDAFKKNLQTRKYQFSQPDEQTFLIALSNVKTSQDIFLSALESNAQICHLKQIKHTLEDAFNNAVEEPHVH